MPSQVTVRLPADFTVILNRLAVQYGMDAAEEPSRQSKAANPNNKAPVPETVTMCEEHITVTGSVHAECSVALELLGTGKRWTNIAIGTSMGSCWFCRQYLKLLQESSGVPFTATNSHGQPQPGWMLPPSSLELEEVHEEMEQKISYELRKIIEQQRRGSRFE